VICAYVRECVCACVLHVCVRASCVSESIMCADAYVHARMLRVRLRDACMCACVLCACVRACMEHTVCVCVRDACVCALRVRVKPTESMPVCVMRACVHYAHA
jgi:hypothetical protein